MTSPGRWPWPGGWSSSADRRGREPCCECAKPLARALVGAAGFAGLPDDLRAQVSDELNVRFLEPLDAVAGELVSHAVKPSFRALGRRFGTSTPAVAAAIEAADPADLAARLRADGSAQVEVDEPWSA